jgi:hypothetical protein
MHQYEKKWKQEHSFYKKHKWKLIGLFVVCCILLLMLITGVFGSDPSPETKAATIAVGAIVAGASTEEAAEATETAAPPTATIPQLDCTDPAILALTKDYYDNKGQWKGRYTMTPIRGAKSSSTSCDVRYAYIPVGGSTATGVDYRRFLFAYNTSTKKWNVTAMGAFQSGKLVSTA